MNSLCPVGDQPTGEVWGSVGSSWPCLAAQFMSAVCLNEDSLYFFSFLTLPKRGFFLQSKYKVQRGVLISDLMEDYRIKKGCFSSRSPLTAETFLSKSDAVSVKIYSPWTFLLFFYFFLCNTGEIERKIKATIKIKISCWSWKRQHNCNMLENCLFLEKVLIKIKFVLSLNFDWT